MRSRNLDKLFWISAWDLCQLVACVAIFDGRGCAGTTDKETSLFEALLYHKDPIPAIEHHLMASGDAYR